MSTGVVVNGYEIRNWHTVSILELARARQEKNQPVVVPVNQKMSKKKTRRSRAMREMMISAEQVKELNARYLAGESLQEIAGGYGISHFTAIKYFGRLGLTYPRPKADVVAAAVPPTPDEQMDEPESIVAAAPSPSPVVEDVEALARQRARDLHERVVADTQVIAVQELPMLARKQYSLPRILESGSVLSINNPHAAAKLVEGLVAKLNEVPGVQAYFEWRAEGQTGQPLAR